MKRALILLCTLTVITIAFIQTGVIKFNEKDKAIKKDTEFVQIPNSLHPTSLSIERKGELQQVKKQPPDKYDTDDAKLVEQIYTEITSFKPVPPNTVISCPASFGISYDMYFFENEKEVLSVNVEGGGCQFVHVENGNALRSNDSFWKMVQEATGMNAKQLWGAPGAF